jgi:hypothetical protein
MSKKPCISCQRIKEGACPACGHVHGELVCDGPAQDPYPGNETCGCESSRDHYLMHFHRVCGEDIGGYIYHEFGNEPDPWYCISAVVHGFDKCWVHLSYEDRALYRERKSV